MAESNAFMERRKRELERRKFDEGDGKGSLVLFLRKCSYSFKFFINPKTPSLDLREVLRHSFQSVSLPCLRMYNMDCDVCKWVETHKNSLNEEDQYFLKRKKYFIGYAELVDVEDEEHKKYIGKIVSPLLPYSVLNGLFDIVKTNEDGQLVWGLNGVVVRVYYDAQYKWRWRVELTPKNMSVSPEKINGLASLMNVYFPFSVTDNIIADIRKLKSDLEDYYVEKYVNKNNSSAGPLGSSSSFSDPLDQPVGSASQNSNQSSGNSDNSGQTKSPESKKVDGKPTCYGNYNDQLHKCLSCPFQMDRCSQDSGYKIL